ncbi:hypothetical protein WMY93_011567 [Mugilogobius chulae]|uniref:Uncharacterized protein n=2 Tax=Mugilogobius chulae TaxID=88201 RepID=A0AAW0P684_9GOBI
MTECTERMDEAEMRLSSVEDQQSDMKAEVERLGKRNKHLEEKLVDLETRSRLNNLRLVNLPEGAEGSDTCAFLEGWLPEALDLIPLRHPLAIERAHRIGPKRAFLGPTILDLQCQTKSTLSEITWVFFAQQFCLLIGSSVGGVFKRTLFSALAALFVSALIISIIFAIIPWCNNVLVLAIAMAVSGLAMGVIDTIANIQLVTIYQKDSAVFLQALHFFIGFGALVSPLIADPFLSESGCGNHTGNETEMIHHFRNMLRHSPIVEHNISQSTAPSPAEEESTVQYAFWIMALINLPIPLAVLYLMYREQLIPCCPSGTPRLLDKDELAMENQQGQETVEPAEHETGGHGDIFSCCQNDNLRGLPVSFFMIHILGGLVLFMTDGIVGAYAGFVYTYAVSPPMYIPHKIAGYLASIFGPLSQLDASYLFPSPIVSSPSDFSCLTWQQYFPLYARLHRGHPGLPRMCHFCLSDKCGMGEMVMQVLVGQIIQTKGSYSFLLCGVIIACIGFIVFFALLLFQRMHRNYLTGTQRRSAMVEESVPEQNGSAKPEQKEEKGSS